MWGILTSVLERTGIGSFMRWVGIVNIPSLLRANSDEEMLLPTTIAKDSRTLTPEDLILKTPDVAPGAPGRSGFKNLNYHGDSTLSTFPNIFSRTAISSCSQSPVHPESLIMPFNRTGSGSLFIGE